MTQTKSVLTGTVAGVSVIQGTPSNAQDANANLVYFHEVKKGGHFAAWEERQLFAEEMCAASKSLH